MDIRKIKKLIELVEESGISELEISEGEESVRISRAAPAASFPVCSRLMLRRCAAACALRSRCTSSS
jgi:biotin carboxyl carrier protein